MTLAVMTNCVLMLTWFPACIAFNEQWSTKCTTIIIPASLVKLKLRFLHFGQLWAKKEQTIIDAIIFYRHRLLFLFSCLAVASIVMIFYYPRLQLPDSLEFQLFDSSHPFEQYDFTYKNLFWFERVEKVGFAHFGVEP